MKKTVSQTLRDLLFVVVLTILALSAFQLATVTEAEEAAATCGGLRCNDAGDCGSLCFCNNPDDTTGFCVLGVPDVSGGGKN